MPRPRVRHLLEQPLVEIGPDTEGRRHHASPAQLARVGDDLLVVRDALIGQAVGEKQGPAQTLAFDIPRHLFAAGQPATTEVRAITRLDDATRRARSQASWWPASTPSTFDSVS